MSAHSDHLRLYLAIFASLLALTALTVLAAFQDFGPWNTPIALTIAVAKATLVVLYFMHVRWSGRLVWVFVVAGFVWLSLLIGFTIMDFGSRDLTPYYVAHPPDAELEASPTR